MPAPTINRSTNATQNSGLNIVTVTADATLTEYVDLVLANAAAGAITLTLDDPSRNPRRVLVIKTDSSGNTVDVGGLATLAAQNDTAEVVSTGAAWKQAVGGVGEAAQSLARDAYGNVLFTDAEGETTVAALVALADIDTVTVEPHGTPDSTEWGYYVIAEDAVGRLTDTGAGGYTDTGAAALDETDFNRITWPAVAGAARYHVVSWDTINFVGTVETPVVTLDDIGQATDPFTLPSVNSTGGFYLKRGDATISVSGSNDIRVETATGDIVLGAAGGEVSIPSASFSVPVSTYEGILTNDSAGYVVIHAAGGYIRNNSDGIDLHPADGKTVLIGARPVRTQIANGSIDTRDDVVLIDATSGNQTLALGAASEMPGRQFTIKRISTNGNTVTVVGTIDGATNYALAALEAITVVSDGTNWWII